MRKLRFLFVLLAMVSLASCNYEEEAVIRYEVTSENPDESYVAEIVPEKIKHSKEENLVNHIDLESERKVWSADRRNTLATLLLHSGEVISNDMIYNISMPKENTSFVITYPEKRKSPNRSEYKQILSDYVKNAGIITEYKHKPSYNLVVSDSAKFSEAKYIDQTINTGYNYYQFRDNDRFYIKVVDYPYVCDMSQLICNLRTYYSIPVIFDDTNKEFLDTRIELTGLGLYSKNISFKKVKETLSILGLALEPTGEMMQVVTYSIAPHKELYAFESRNYTIYFWNIILLSILLGIAIIFMDDAQAHYYDLLPKNKNIKERLKYAVPFWVIAMAFAVFFVMLISNIENYSFDVEQWILICIYFTIIPSACGIYVLRHRKSNSKKNERIISYILYILLLIIWGINFCTDKEYYDSGFEISIGGGIGLIVGGSTAYFLNKKKKKEQNNEN